MKRLIKFSVIFVVVFLVCAVFIIRCSFIYKDWFYLVKKDNYISIEAEIAYVDGYDRYEEEFCFDIKDCSYPLQKLSRGYSPVSVLSKTMSMSNHKREITQLEPGDIIEFVTAPRFLGNGWVFPIVALKIDGETMIEFEDGYKDLIEDYLEKYPDLRLFRRLYEKNVNE